MRVVTKKTGRVPKVALRVAVNRCRNLSKDPLVLVHRPEDQNPHETDPSNTEKVEERGNDRVQRGRGNNPHEV